MSKNKKELLNSLLAFVLALSMFVGTTFAWFTDTVKTGQNTINAGSLKADVLHYDDENAKADSEGWVSLKENENHKLFSYNHWEPGYVQYETIKIANKGNLAFQYRFLAKLENEITGANGERLADVIDVYIAEGVQTPEVRSAITDDTTGTWKLLDTLSNVMMKVDGLASGELLPESEAGKGTAEPVGESVYTIALHMQETAGNGYQNLSLGDFYLDLYATQYTYEEDSFGKDYDAGAFFPEINYPISIAAEITGIVENGVLTETVVITGPYGVRVTIPEGVCVEDGATKLTLSLVEKEESESNVTLGENEQLKAFDVHVEGIAEDNTVPMTIEMGEVLPIGLNKGNLQVYHIEDGNSEVMEEVPQIEDFTKHNQFTYEPETGATALYMATFSEITAVADTENAWNGEYDYSWYTNVSTYATEGDTSDYVIANADQLAAFGVIVGGMNGQTQDSFTDKTVKLISDVNLGDAESENNSDIIFYPIGYYNNAGSYEKKSGGSVTSSVSSFEGTFDGNGHTISNFYQNTWEMFGDYNDGYSGTPNHYKDAMGLFGYVLNGTVKNLTVDNFSSDGEYTPTGVIAAYAAKSTFENIAITNCNPRVYNTGNGGIVGIGGNTDDSDTYKLTFENITIDNSNTISALWGSWDVACGGLVGMFRGAGHVYMTNCHVAAQMDVYNDVCGNYQYYWYRYSGMMVGANKNMITDEKGYMVPETEKFHASGCTVHFGEWNDYYYCELVANSLASYTHDHQFSRLEQVDDINTQNMTIKVGGKETSIPASGRCNYVVVEGESATENATCYHFVDGKIWKHDDAGKETVGGKEVLKEDNQHIYLPFNQLFTGYGWGVKHIPIYNDGTPNPFPGVTILDREKADSVVKFEKVVNDQVSFEKGSTVEIKELFKAATITNDSLVIKSENVQVTVSPVGDDSTVSAVYEANENDWTQGTLVFSGTGAATITITDYYFCKPTTLEIEVVNPAPIEKFDLVFENTDKYLYRVGNANTVALASLFSAKAGVEIGAVDVEIVPLNDTSVRGTYTANSTDWTKATIQFTGTGPVKVTITDDKNAAKKVLYLEVINAKNITKPESATANDVVLLNDISGTFTVSNGHTFHGNGFKVTLPTITVQEKGQGFTGYISIGATQDDGAANGGNLDNVRIVGPVYPEMYIYRSQAEITDKNDPDYGSGNNMRYFRNSVIVYGGNCTISNSYISGSRTALCLRGGNNVVIENTTLSGGAYANMQICAGSSVTLRDLTTVQVDVLDSYGKGKTAHGLGVAVESGVVDIYIEGELNQYNWLNQDQWNEIVPSAYQGYFPKFFTDDQFSMYRHSLNNGTSHVNMAFIFACNWNEDKIHDNRSTVDYETTGATIKSPNGEVSGGVYSKSNTEGSNVISDVQLTDPGYLSQGFNPIAPMFNFDNTPNSDDDDANDANDTYCVYKESTGTLKIGVNGDSKTLDLSKVDISKNGTSLEYTAYLNGAQISGNSVNIKVADGAKQTLTFKAASNDAGYDEDGNLIKGSIKYSWTVNVELAVLSYPAPVWNMEGTYKFDATKNSAYAYYGTSNGYGEAVPIYEGIKINYYDKNGKLVELDLSGTTTHPTGSNNSNSNAFTYTLSDGSTLTMKFLSGWKSGATTHQFTTYNNKVYIYPQSLDNDNYIRAKVANQDFDVKINYTFTDPNGQSISQVMQWYNAKGYNSKVTTVQWKTFDSINGKKPSTCVAPDTLVTLADGIQKEIQYVTYEDKLLVWDFNEGKYTVMPSSIVMNHGYDKYQIVTLEFEDGTVVNTINGHGFFDTEENKFVILSAKNVEDYIGHEFVKQDGDGYTTIKLVDYSIREEYTESWSVLTAEYYNCILEGMLTLTPAEVEGSPDYLMPFEIDDNMKYNKIKKWMDVQKYGLYTYEEFSDYVTEEQFEALGLAEFKVSVGKGYITYEEILDLLNLHMGK